jgi:hypothetical protein
MHWTSLLVLLLLASCGGQAASSADDVGGHGGATSEGSGGATAAGRAGSSPAGVGGVDTSTLPEPSTPSECDAVEYPGTINGRSFAVVLAEARQKTGSCSSQCRISIEGMPDTWGLGCFDDLVDYVVIPACRGTFWLRQLPRGVRSVTVESGCELATIEGVANVSTVVLNDAGQVTDFSALEGSSVVSVGGPASLERLGPHVLWAKSLSLDVEGMTLSPLNGILATSLIMNVTGVRSVADFVPGPNLTCFDIVLKDLTTEASQAEVSSLCTDTVNGVQCPDYNGCFMTDRP